MSASEPNGSNNKKIPGLSDAEKHVADNPYGDDSSAKEAELFSRGESIRKIRKSAQEKEEGRAELFRDNFEWMSIVGLWLLFIIFSALTVVWSHDLIVPEKRQWVDNNKDEKLQIIITSGFVAGIASAHVKKRLG